MRPEVAKLVEDARQACALLGDFTRGKSFPEYQHDALLRAAVEREFIIIGEALLKASKLDPSLPLSIAAFQQIIGFRHVLVHGYASIQHQTVWGVVLNDLDPLQQSLEKLLTQAAPP